MKKILIVTVLLMVSCVSAMSQVQEPVSLTYSAKKTDAVTYEIHITAAIQSGWHIYSQTTPAGGPVHTTVTFSSNPLAIITGNVKEVGKLEQHHEKLFGVDVKQFSNKVDFVQIVKLKKALKTNIAGSIEFMVCNDQQCLPPATKKFSVALK
ncbi:MAG: protein-disulfide reductase DsbD domain-containing protein [Bacteroidota bacterium]